MIIVVSSYVLSSWNSICWSLHKKGEFAKKGPSLYEDATCEVFLVKNMQISNKNSFPGLKNWRVVIWFLDGVRQYRQIYLEEINSVGAGVDCKIVFKTATKLTSETCTHNVRIDIGVDVYFDIVGMLTLTLSLSRTL